MNEFQNRLEAQRTILRIVNSRGWKEELFGLSHDSIKRWCLDNQLGAESKVVSLLRAVSSRLSFLAIKSQDPVSSDYERMSDEIERLADKIKDAVDTA